MIILACVTKLRLSYFFRSLVHAVIDKSNWHFGSLAFWHFVFFTHSSRDYDIGSVYQPPGLRAGELNQYRNVCTGTISTPLFIYLIGACCQRIYSVKLNEDTDFAMNLYWKWQFLIYIKLHYYNYYVQTHVIVCRFIELDQSSHAKLRWIFA